MKIEGQMPAQAASLIERNGRQAAGSSLCTFPQFLEQANALILGTDRRGSLRFCSRLLLELTGRRWEELRGSPLVELFPLGERPRIAELFANALRGERTRLETRLLFVDGKPARISLASSPLFDSQRRVRGAVAIGEDLRAAEALQARLLQTEKLASLGRFAASVAHEINNPLTAVVACAEALLARAPLAEERDGEKLRKILDGCERILRLTRQLVSYARPASDQVECIPLPKLLETALSYCEHVLSHHEISVAKEYPSTPEVIGIKAKLAQVFVNVITNACQAMPPGGVLHLAIAENGQWAVVRLSDNGPGMDAATLQRVFEPFFTTKPEGMGSGLGLFIARSIVESHSGEIEVTSSVGRGATFAIRLPLAATRDFGGESRSLDNSPVRSAI